MKKKILILLAAALSLTAAVSGTLAYFNDTVTTHNIITTGGVSIELIEKTKNDSGTDIIWPAEGLSGIMPGTSASKIVSVANKGQADAWIRVKVKTTGEFADGTSMQGDQLDPIQINFNQTDWTKNGDYWYYKQSVGVDEFTTALFTTVEFDEQMGNEYQNCTVYIDVTAEAVQTANNGSDPLTAAGWPNEPTE